jgi:hypothetical protein
MTDPACMIDITSMHRKLRLFCSGNKFVAGMLRIYPTFDRSLAGISSSDEVRPAPMRPHIVQYNQRFERPVYHSVSCDAKSYLYGSAPLIVGHFWFASSFSPNKRLSLGKRSGIFPCRMTRR